MKILEINKYFFVKGGAEKHFFDVVDLLEKNGHEVAVFSMSHDKNLNSRWSNYFLSTVGYTDEFTLVQKIKGVFRMFYSFEAKKKINRLLDEFNPDLVHVHNIYHQLSPMILFEIKKRNIPIVMTVHDYKLVNPNYNLFYQGKFYNRCLDGKYYQCFLDRCFKNSYFQSFLAMLEMYWHEFFGTYKKNIDLYIVPSEFVKNILIERGVDKDKIRVLPHFISSAKKEETQEKEGEKFALCMGRISKEKGVNDVVSIFSQLNGVSLYLAGSIENGFKIPNSKNIKYLGHLSKEELEKYIQESMCVISGSKLPETFGLVALESISQGKPFVGFNTGAYGEIIKNGENGYLAKNKNEMKGIFEDIISGKIVFNEDKIKYEANLKYDRKAYMNLLINIFKGAIDRIGMDIDKNHFKC